MELPSHENFTASKRTVALPNGIVWPMSNWVIRRESQYLLLHGFTDTARSWTLIARHLAKNFRLVAPDLRGHGQSDKPDGCYTIPEMANDVRLLTEVLGSPRSTSSAIRWADGSPKHSRNAGLTVSAGLS